MLLIEEGLTVSDCGGNGLAHMHQIKCNDYDTYWGLICQPSPLVNVCLLYLPITDLMGRRTKREEGVDAFVHTATNVYDLISFHSP